MLAICYRPQYVEVIKRPNGNIWDGRSDQSREAGGRLNKKDGLTRYGDSHVKDKTS